MLFLSGAPHVHGVLWLDLSLLEKMNHNLEVTEDPEEPKIFPNLKSAFRKLKADEELTEGDLESLVRLVDTFSRQACSPLIQLFFGFASDIDQTIACLIISYAQFSIVGFS